MNRLAMIALTVLALTGVLFMTSRLVAAQVGGDSAEAGKWGLTTEDREDTICDNSGEDATYRITSSAESSATVTVVRTKKNGDEINGSERTLEPGESIDFGVAKEEGIKVKIVGQADHTANGTYDKV